MADTILVPIDGSEQAWAALDYALGEHGDDEIRLLYVINPMEGVYASDAMGGDYWAGWYDAAEERADRLFEDARERAGDSADDLVIAHETGAPARTIVEYAEAEGVDHIVIGSHGRSGVSRVLLGSVAEAVARRASVPVTIVR